MDDYLKHFREMISLRGLTDHTIVSYSTYIRRSYLDYLSNLSCTRCRKMFPGRNCVILSAGCRKKRIFLTEPLITVFLSSAFLPSYVLHKPWDPTQLPLRKSDAYLPYVPSQELKLSNSFPPCPASSPGPCAHSCIPPACVSGKCAACAMRILTEKTCASISPIPKPGRTAMPLCPGMPWTCSHSIGFNAAGLQAGFSQAPRNVSLTDRSIPIIFPGISISMRNGLAGPQGSPATPSGTPSVHICMRMALTCLLSRHF